MATIEKILILDENEANILFFETLLASMERGFRVFTAVTGPHAEIIVKEKGIQFVICAWEMNAMPGTIFVQRIRNHRARRHMPCLIFSKRMSEQDATLLREFGLNDVIGMPFDKEKSISVIKKMVEAEEKLTPVQKKLRKIEDLIADNKPTEGLQIADASVTQKGPDFDRAMACMGELWMMTRNLSKAEESLLAGLAHNPDHIDCKRLLAKLYSQTGRHTEAIKILEDLTSKSPKNIKSLLSLGSAYVDADQHDKAKQVFGKVKSLDGDSQECKDEEAKLAFKVGDFNLAAQLLAETNNGDDLARHFNNMAISKVAAKEFQEGVKIYRNAMSVLSSKARLYQLNYNLGLAFMKNGDLEDAFICLCDSYVAEPSFEKAYSALAKVAKEMKDKGKKPDPQRVEQVKEVRAKLKPPATPQSSAA